eukprot:CAMPEP_0179931458 /NCGR_PEP_ID=MMETSP0983-20121128/10672_1 /TAXON_ID=483367 /ORGANISM="non described non described, Strain CCMP 2436" /LENGTH=137 /DNA_ID=CAMNT_0021835851 /DNA_START=462 /DNA_END=872 /DNA_ORIENTATION=+
MPAHLLRRGHGLFILFAREAVGAKHAVDCLLHILGHLLDGHLLAEDGAHLIGHAALLAAHPVVHRDRRTRVRRVSRLLAPVDQRALFAHVLGPDLLHRHLIALEDGAAPVHARLRRAERHAGGVCCARGELLGGRRY